MGLVREGSMNPKVAPGDKFVLSWFLLSPEFQRP